MLRLMYHELLKYMRIVYASLCLIVALSLHHQFSWKFRQKKFYPKIFSKNLLSDNQKHTTGTTQVQLKLDLKQGAC